VSQRQVTQCYKLETPRRFTRFRASNTVLQALIVAVLVIAATGCGGASNGGGERTPRPVSLAGWRVADDAPGISQLAPSLSGLDITSRVDAPALVRRGDVIRAASFVFRSPADAAEAQKRGAGDDYQRAIEEAFRGDTIGRGPGVGLRLRVPRPTGTGSDTVEIYLFRRGRTLTVVELESAVGFDPALRAKALGLFSR
jgi:hypothetical protein